MNRPASALLLVSLLVPTLAACREGHTEQAHVTPPTVVRVAGVERVQRARPVVSTGALATKSEVRASFKVGGIIRSITVDEGQVIKKGQILATLTTTEIDAGVAQAQEAVDKAQRDRDRVAKLLDGRAATGSQLEDATTGLEVARAQLRAAAFNRNHAVIRAPRDGKVLKRMAEPDELVAPGQPILVLSGDDTSWVLRVGLADRDVVRLHQGDVASLDFPAFPGAPPLTATVSEIASAATPPLGTYEVELRVSPAGRPLRAGMIAHALIQPQAHEYVTLVPAVALRDGNGTKATVWVPRPDGSVEKRIVETAFFDGDRVALRSGLDGVDKVVTDGAPYLGESSRIEVRP